MIVSSNCAPTLIFIGFSLIQILIDFYKGLTKEAFIKFVVMIIFSVIINILCNLGYRVIAWFLVFIPIIMMTLISTLLLKVFGTNTEDKDLRSQIKLRSKDFSDNIIEKDGDFYLNDSEDNNLLNNLSELKKNSFFYNKLKKKLDINDNSLENTDLLNQQEYAFFYDRFNSVDRINRDSIRKNLYDKLEKDFKLNSEKNSLYDLSNNNIKYNIVDEYINNIGEKIFNNNVSSLYNKFNNNRILNNYNIVKLRENQELLNNSLDNMNKNDIVSYNRIYNDNYLFDGHILYRRNNIEAIKNEYPDLTDIDLLKIIDYDWNNLTAEQRERWNRNAKNEVNENIKYNADQLNLPFLKYINGRRESTKYNNNIPCPINETKESYNAKTGYDCYYPCPPGKVRNSLDICVAPCGEGKERKERNGDCLYI